MCRNCNCACCPYLTASMAIAVDQDKLEITIPATTINNNEKVCLLLTQTIPAGAGSLPVYLVDGTDGTEIQLVDRRGDSVRADQIRTRKIYNLRVMTEPALAVVHSNNLCCTAYVWPQITPPAVTPAPAPTTKTTVAK